MHKRSRFALIPVLAVGVLLVGCGDDDSSSGSTSSTSPSTSSAEQSVDSAVSDCSEEAKKLGGAGGSALEAACTSVGDSAKKALESGSESTKAALTSAASSCNSTVSQLPKGTAQDSLTKLCDALASAD
jgi:hypothetical protein